MQRSPNHSRIDHDQGRPENAIAGYQQTPDSNRDESEESEASRKLQEIEEQDNPASDPLVSPSRI
ncbi:MAG TPA: hypothetical protein VMU49_02210 [Candidatus Acidoferrales bacterium]|nr:hypothetical protein [Candidatus Acidoferrales bacterium]